mmetsp:Transcript_43327/g.101973  ORF Transcript_43327/g.101973 Transcript_43327/m.101973 type:complete len:80 (-) Transcript_43327:570-809(-)
MKGLAIARHLLTSGSKVMIADIDRASSAAAAEELGQLGACRFMDTDVQDEGAVTSMIAATIDEFGALDILVFAPEGVGD